MNRCLVCNKEIEDNRKTCSPTCRTTHSNRLKGENNLKKYIENPNHCLYCKKPIMHKDGDILSNTQIKKFCNRNCAAYYNNRNRPLSSYVKANAITVDRKCYKCHQTFSVSRNSSGNFPRNAVCEICRTQSSVSVGQRTIEDLFRNRKNYQSARSDIRRHAYDIYMKSDKPCVCKICGYGKHIDVAHIKSVSSFRKDTLIKNVNSIDNLVALCLNHHWEYDHDLLNENDLSIIRGLGGVEERPSSSGS